MLLSLANYSFHSFFHISSINQLLTYSLHLHPVFHPLIFSSFHPFTLLPIKLPFTYSFTYSSTLPFIFSFTNQSQTIHYILHPVLHSLIYWQINHPLITSSSFFLPIIQSTTEHSFTSSFILLSSHPWINYEPQSHLHPSFHPVIHQPSLPHYSQLLPVSHASILSSNNQSLITYYMFINTSHPLVIHSFTHSLQLHPYFHHLIHQPTAHPLIHIFIHTCHYLLAKHWPPTKPSSKHPSCHASAKQSCTHYIFIYSSILSSISQPLTLSLHLIPFINPLIQ